MGSRSSRWGLRLGQDDGGKVLAGRRQVFDPDNGYRDEYKKI